LRVRTVVWAAARYRIAFNLHYYVIGFRRSANT
jgi:hypothetical protein